MWVRFTADFDWRGPTWTRAFKGGMRCNLTRECLKAAGDRVERIPTPSKAVAAELAKNPRWTGDQDGSVGGG